MSLIASIVSSSTFRSIPAYKSSVFSLTTTKSTSLNGVFIPSMFLQGRIFAYKSSSRRSCTLTDLNPLPIGVVTGALSAILFFFMLSITRSGRGTPSFSMTSRPADCLSQLILTPAASIIFTTASAISGPIPSPSISVILCIISSFSYKTSTFYDFLKRR